MKGVVPMQFLAPILLCALLLAVLFGLARLFLFLSNRAALRSVYQSGNYTASTVHTMLLAKFGSKHLISGKLFPRKTEKGAVYTLCDHLVITDSAVVLITICEGNGRVQNLSSSDIWTVSVRTKTGEREHPFQNPISAGNGKKDALSALLMRAKLPFAVPVEQIVIFPSRRVTFAMPRQKEIQSPPEAMRTLNAFQKTKRFSKEKKRLIYKALKRRACSASQVRAKAAKLRQKHKKTS